MVNGSRIGRGLRCGALALGALLASCSLGEAPCPCGQQYSNDPFDLSGDPLNIGTQHSRSDHCLCYCNGSGDEQRMPPSRNCTGYESIACATDDGHTGLLVCP